MPDALSISAGGEADYQGSPRIVSQEEAACVAAILQEFGQFTSWRSIFAQQWEEAAALILPSAKNTFFYQSYNTEGAKRTEQQIDASGALALHKFCAIADSLVTPRNQLWHGLENDAEYIMKDRRARLWYEQTTLRLFKMRYAHRSGFVGQNYSGWQSVGAFGNTTMYVDKLDERHFGRARGLRYRAIPLGETFYGENHQGIVDRMIRWFRLTAYQAAQKWGKERLPQNLLPALQQNSQWRYNFLHCVKPRDDYDPERLDAKGMPFGSYYVSIEGQCLMAPEGGFRVFPFAVRRYDQAPNETYGRGPAQIVLPSLKTLNAEKKVFLKQGHRAADPVLLMADDGIMSMNLVPGAQNKGAMTGDGKKLVDILPSGDIQISKEMMADERGLIDETFLVSLLRTLVENPNMKATQVIELVNERAMLIAPTLGRQHDEYVGQMVERELDLAAEMRLIDPPPRIIMEAREHYKVKDTSPLAKAARSGRAAGFLRALESSKEIVTITQDPSHLDWANLDEAQPEIARINDTPEAWINTPEQIAKKRTARSKAQQQQQAIENLKPQASMVAAQAKAQKAGGGGMPQQQLPSGGGPQQQMLPTA